MEKDNYKTDVVFRLWPDGQILALFPYEIETWDGKCLSYMHIGQHSSADYQGCIKATKPAKDYQQYASLKHELESIGYDLNVIRKRKSR